MSCTPTTCIATCIAYSLRYPSTTVSSVRRAFSSSTNKKTTSSGRKSKPRSVPINSKPVPSSTELLKEFLSSSNTSGEAKPDKRGKRKSKTYSELPQTSNEISTQPQKKPFVRIKQENVINSKSLLKDFLNMELKPEKLNTRYSAKGKESVRIRYTEQLPAPENLRLFHKSKMAQKDEAIDTGAYNNAVYDEIEALEMSTHRAKSTLNRFEELMQWTLDGKLWRYPIDNEQDWTEEQSTGFDEHIFLDRFIDRKLQKPAPLNAFMELVCAGLAQNPYITAHQKKEHLNWFEKYFVDKVEQIDLAVREEKRIAEVESKAKPIK